jgi:hypothetical protein
VVLLCNLGAETCTVQGNTIYMKLSVMPGQLEIWPLNAVCVSVVACNGDW